MCGRLPMGYLISDKVRMFCFGVAVRAYFSRYQTNEPVQLVVGLLRLYGMVMRVGRRYC